MNRREFSKLFGIAVTGTLLIPELTLNSEVKSYYVNFGGTYPKESILSKFEKVVILWPQMKPCHSDAKQVYSISNLQKCQFMQYPNGDEHIISSEVPYLSEYTQFPWTTIWTSKEEWVEKLPKSYILTTQIYNIKTRIA